MARVECSVHAPTTNPLCFTCLRAMCSVDGGDDPMGAGRLMERALIVRWLRSLHCNDGVLTLSDRIEKGEYLKVSAEKSGA
jgi:hypothetical protein